MLMITNTWEINKKPSRSRLNLGNENSYRHRIRGNGLKVILIQRQYGIVVKFLKTGKEETQKQNWLHNSILGEFRSVMGNGKVDLKAVCCRDKEAQEGRETQKQNWLNTSI